MGKIKNFRNGIAELKVSLADALKQGLELLEENEKERHKREYILHQIEIYKNNNNSAEDLSDRLTIDINATSDAIMKQLKDMLTPLCDVEIEDNQKNKKKDTNNTGGFIKRYINRKLDELSSGEGKIFKDKYNLTTNYNLTVTFHKSGHFLEINIPEDNINNIYFICKKNDEIERICFADLYRISLLNGEDTERIAKIKNREMTAMGSNPNYKAYYTMNLFNNITNVYADLDKESTIHLQISCGDRDLNNKDIEKVNKLIDILS